MCSIVARLGRVRAMTIMGGLKLVVGWSSWLVQQNRCSRGWRRDKNII